MTSAVVFGYGDIGVRCLTILLAQGVDVRLVVTHTDDPNENRWYSSLAELAARRKIPCITPASVDESLVKLVADLAPDFLFSFYYRFMLPAAMLRTGRRGALNLHGSLLPRFRGRAPVNWAVLRGATETGATLHYMVERADAGDIVDQQAVPILENDTAYDVFLKVADAAEKVVARALPRLVAGTADARPQNLEQGEYCGRRRPEDGRIDWSKPAREIHNLVRAVAPPFPGAFADVGGERWILERTRVLPRNGAASSERLRLHAAAGTCVITCSDGEELELLAARNAQGPLDMNALAARLERAALPVS